MIETKEAGKVSTDEVYSRPDAGLEFCKSSTEYHIEKDGKPWKYALILHNKVTAAYLLSQFTN